MSKPPPRTSQGHKNEHRIRGSYHGYERSYPLAVPLVVRLVRSKKKVMFIEHFVDGSKMGHDFGHDSANNHRWSRGSANNHRWLQDRSRGLLSCPKMRIYDSSENRYRPDGHEDLVSRNKRMYVERKTPQTHLPRKTPQTHLSDTPPKGYSPRWVGAPAEYGCGG